VLDIFLPGSGSIVEVRRLTTRADEPKKIFRPITFDHLAGKIPCSGTPRRARAAQPRPCACSYGTSRPGLRRVSMAFIRAGHLRTASRLRTCQLSGVRYHECDSKISRKDAVHIYLLISLAVLQACAVPDLLRTTEFDLSRLVASRRPPVKRSGASLLSACSVRKRAVLLQA
jgi:hypothetical protein